MKKTGFLAVFLLTLFVSATNVWAQTGLPIRLAPYLSGFTSPVFATSARDGSGRFFVVEQSGVIKVVQPNSTTPTEFLNITSRVVAGGERGLLGLAFHPQYAMNRRFFVYYTRQSDGAIQIAEYQASATNPNVANTTEKILLTIPHPDQSNHNGGTIAFGADGYLYAGTGDGGGANDLPNNAQNINVLLGKFLRIDVNVPAGSTQNYLIPSDNPYAGATAGADEIYAIGLRNPYRWSFDRGTNQLWAGDVGQGLVEEVDIITRGGNFGWRIMEGTVCNPNLNGGVCTPPAGHIPPIFEYNNVNSPRCAVTGGYVYRGARRTLPFGGYLYGDYCTGEIFLWNNNQQTLLLDSSLFLSSFAEDENGELYAVGLVSGTVEKIVSDALLPSPNPSADFDGDLKTDISVFRPSNGFWYSTNSSNNEFRFNQFGQNGDVPVPEDYDGDDKTDIAVYRPSNGNWYILRSSSNTFSATQFGANTDVPAAGDYDGDGRADITVFRPTNGTWYRLNSINNNAFFSIQFGQNGDIPAHEDFDDDGKTDITVFRPSNGFWYAINSSNGAFSAVQFGQNGDMPVQGDYDGDGKGDQAVFRPSNGFWYLRRSALGFAGTQFGQNGDVPVAGDYDGDLKTDIAVWRSGTWFILRSSNNGFQSVQFGQNGDLPAPFYDKP